MEKTGFSILLTASMAICNNDEKLRTQSPCQTVVCQKLTLLFLQKAQTVTNVSLCYWNWLLWHWKDQTIQMTLSY